MILLASLLSSLLSLLLTEGLLTSPLPRQYGLRSLDDVVYRKYKRGDDLSLMAPLNCDIFTCWVAVTSGDRKVVGVVEMVLPQDDVSPSIKAAIENLRPKASKKKPDGIIAQILLVHVAKSWRNKKIGSNLLPQVFRDLPKGYPEWDVVYLKVGRSNDAAIRLYEKTGFIKILDTPGDLLVYARYNLS